LVIAAMVALVAAAAVLAFSVSAESLALPGETPAPTFTFAARPSPTFVPVSTLAPDALRVFSVGPLPADFRDVLVGDAGDERLLLLDLGGKRVTLVAHFEGTASFETNRVVETATVAAGDTVVMLAHSDGANARLYVIKPATGGVRSFTIPRSEQPRLSPDASTVAVTRNSSDPEQNGLWLLNANDGSGRRLLADSGRRATRVVQWSADGKRLSALVDVGAGQTELIVLDRSGGATPLLGKATDARWRGTDLLYWDFTVPGPMRQYDAANGIAAPPAYAPASGVIVDRAELRPRSAGLAVREHTSSSLPRILVYDGSTGTSSVKVVDAQWVLGFWWSADATRLYAWNFDNGTTTVRDVLSDELVMTFCFRVKIDPPCP
jgi:hypothetical protein